MSQRVLIIVENLPVPFDRRVWQEATALRNAGWTVSVICPKGRGHDLSYEEADGVHIFGRRCARREFRWEAEVLTLLAAYAALLPPL